MRSQRSKQIKDRNSDKLRRRQTSSIQVLQVATTYQSLVILLLLVTSGLVWGLKYECASILMTANGACATKSCVEVKYNHSLCYIAAENEARASKPCASDVNPDIQTDYEVPLCSGVPKIFIFYH